LYKTFVQGELVCSNARTAEMCKLTENSFRDVNIAFANELSIICDKLGINVWELIQLANRHPRVNILQPGAGVGGHCIAVDPWFIVDSAPDEARLIRTAREVNDHKPEWVLQKVKAAITDVLAQRPGATMSEVKVACLGLAFKPDIDDLRESPAVEVTFEVSKLGCRVLVVEPNIEHLSDSRWGPNVALVSLHEALSEADIACVLVKHKTFLSLYQRKEARPTLVDAVGVQGRRSDDS
jgi:UDP-N-acetyl-D-mannosaminuronic acid dehydrogenase